MLTQSVSKSLSTLQQQQQKSQLKLKQFTSHFPPENWFASVVQIFRLIVPCAQTAQTAELLCAK